MSKYVAKERYELNMLFTDDIADMDFDFRFEKLRGMIETWQQTIPQFDGWNTIYIDNYDSRRSLLRYALDIPQFRATAAKMHAIYLGSLLFLSQGQEIGMVNKPRDWVIVNYIDMERNGYDNDG